MMKRETAVCPRNVLPGMRDYRTTRRTASLDERLGKRSQELNDHGGGQAEGGEARLWRRAKQHRVSLLAFQDDGELGLESALAGERRQQTMLELRRCVTHRGKTPPQLWGDDKPRFPAFAGSERPFERRYQQHVPGRRDGE